MEGASRTQCAQEACASPLSDTFTTLLGENRRSVAVMNWLQTTIEQLVGYAVAWDETASWFQAIFSVVAIGAAVWVDRGSARRQRRQFEQAELAKAVEKIEAVVTISSLSSYALRWTQDIFEAMTPTTDIPWPTSYRKWAGIMSECREAFVVLMPKVTDPIMLSNLVAFMHCMRPPEVHERSDCREILEEALTAMRDTGDRLIATAQTIAEDANVLMHIPALSGLLLGSQRR